MSALQFVERTEAEAGFSAVFADRIAPKLGALDAKREALRKKGRKSLLTSLAVGTGLAWLILLLTDSTFGTFFAILVFGVGVIAGLSFREQAADAWGDEISQLVMPAVCDHVGDVVYDRDGGGDFPTRDAQRLGLFGDYDDAHLSHDISGTHHGVAFRVVRARLTETSSDPDGDRKTTTVFNGLLFEIAVPDPAPATILIARDWGRVLNGFATLFKYDGRGMPRIETGHQRFEQVFELHARPAFDVASYLPPAFLDTLVEISLHEGGKANAMTAGFTGSRFLMALRRKDKFLDYHDLGRATDTLVKDLHGVFHDITLPHRIIDRLAGL